MTQLLFTVGCFITFLTVGGIVLLGGHLLDAMEVRENSAPVAPSADRGVSSGLPGPG